MLYIIAGYISVWLRCRQS